MLTSSLANRELRVECESHAIAPRGVGIYINCDYNRAMAALFFSLAELYTYKEDDPTGERN